MEDSNEDADVKIKESERKITKDIKEHKKQSDDKLDRKASETKKQIDEADD